MIESVKSNSSVVSYDSSSSVSIRKSGNYTRLSCRSHLSGISIEYTLIMSFSVFGENIHHLIIYLVSVGLARRFRHTNSAKGLQRSFERLIGLKTHYLFKILVKISGTVTCNSGYYLGIHIKHSSCLSFLLRQLHDHVPKL